jgi:lysophospholipase L1-like esterase
VKIIRNIFAGLAFSLLAACGGGSAVQQTPTPTPQQAPPISNVVAFMGDSITNYWPLADYDPSPTVNLGVAGQTTVQMLARFDSVTAAAPGVVVILGGVNDFVQFGVSGTSIDSIKAMAAQADAAGIRVILCSVLPINEAISVWAFKNTDIGAFNQQLITLAKENGYLYVDYYDEMINADATQNTTLFMDVVHPNAAGYAVMWKALAPLVQESLQ